MATSPPSLVAGNESELVAEEAAELGLRQPLKASRRAFSGVSTLKWDPPGLPRAADIVLLHGAALNAHTWDATVLIWGRSALAVDLPGHGESQWRADADYSPATLAGELGPVLAAAAEQGLVSGQVTLVGQSLGGLAAVELGHLLGNLVERVVLVDVLPLGPEAAQAVADFLDGPTIFDSREEIALRARQHGLGGAPRRLERAVAHNTRIGEDGGVRWKHHFGSPTGEARRRLRLDQAAGWERLAALPQAVDLVWGSRGITDPSARDRFRRSRPDARLVEVAAGHNIQEDQPKDLAAGLADLTGTSLEGK
jgi:pimeloyl-ACP methyl ester carboxylesterase